MKSDKGNASELQSSNIVTDATSDLVVLRQQRRNLWIHVARTRMLVHNCSRNAFLTHSVSPSEAQLHPPNSLPRQKRCRRTEDKAVRRGRNLVPATVDDAPSAHSLAVDARQVCARDWVACLPRLCSPFARVSTCRQNETVDIITARWILCGQSGSMLERASTEGRHVWSLSRQR